MYSYGPPYMAERKQDDQLEHIYSSCVRIRNVALETCQRRWTIGRSGERGSRHDDDDELTYIKTPLKISVELLNDFRRAKSSPSVITGFCESTKKWERDWKRQRQRDWEGKLQLQSVCLHARHLPMFNVFRSLSNIVTTEWKSTLLNIIST